MGIVTVEFSCHLRAMNTSSAIPSVMHFIDCPDFGGPEVLLLTRGPTPIPGDEEVLIRVEAAGVNRPDIAGRMGKYPPPPGASPVLGLEVAGTVVQRGKNVGGNDARWAIGDRVCALVPGGGYAEYCIAPASHCLPIPEGLTMVEAAGIPETFFTVWANVFQMGRLQAGDRFLVHGGTSGIGTTAIQLATAFGATVFATAGSLTKCAACVALGAKAAVDYKRNDFQSEILNLTEGKGVDLILDMVGGTYTSKNIECLAVDGRLVQIATLLGYEATIDLRKIMQKRIHFTGSTMRPRTVAEKAEIASALYEKVWPLLVQKKVKVQVDRVFPMNEVAEAHRYMESSRHIGKIILLMASV